MSFDCNLFTGSDPVLFQFCTQLVTAHNSLEGDVNSFFILWASVLVIFMHVGFAMLSAGAVRSKNAKNILLSILMDLAVSALVWYLVGFAFAFGDDLSGFIGTSFWVGLEVGSEFVGTGSFYFWLFEFAFAATAATIVSGAIAERARFETYLVTSAWISGWVYPLTAHWLVLGFVRLFSTQNLV